MDSTDSYSAGSSGGGGLNIDDVGIEVEEDEEKDTVEEEQEEGIGGVEGMRCHLEVDAAAGGRPKNCFMLICFVVEDLAFFANEFGGAGGADGAVGTGLVAVGCDVIE